MDIIVFITSPLFILIIFILVSLKYLPKSFTTNRGLKIVFAILGFVWYISFAYYTPDQVRALYTRYGIPFQPAFDNPMIFFLLVVVWLIYTMLYYGFVQLQRASDVVVAAGVDKPQSCTSADLMEVGDHGFIRAGGTKPIPIPGSSVWINPLTHIHRIGTHLILSAQCIQATNIVDVPYMLKRHVRQRRFDLLGVKDCSVGYLTRQEQEAHKEIPKNKYSSYLSKEEINTKKPLYTSTFLNKIVNMNIIFDSQLQLTEHENTSVKKFFETHAGIGKSVQESEKKGLKDYILGG